MPKKQKVNKVNEDTFAVEKILDRKIIKGIPWYLIKWEGYSDSDNTWEPRENINADELIEDFESKIPLKRKRTRTTKLTENKSDFIAPGKTIQERVTSILDSLQEYYDLNLESIIFKVCDLKIENNIIKTAVVQYTDKSMQEIPYFIVKKEVPKKLFEYYEEAFNKFTHKNS
ncbi:hypothetical protein NCER_101155 [Vairimorpha ceranae BRL01]|uniref:Chromo domain-containing protein n=2 Tax=Vairimorpha ceranae TaxID=40302 RepID=C4V9C4_VAIC1|nr:chromobox protein [Vairimorpha ceranae]EEQ82176.1 hypothetical protein NCER_101155 [Vairimorpha ceranae BRL01]KAF5140363.1 hypothetical protein G9O61_00g014710 [Vairimorpha ceranae]KKO75451.1 chromobox protein [Vairimorpha ceranae]